MQRGKNQHVRDDLEWCHDSPVHVYTVNAPPLHVDAKEFSGC